MATGELFLFTTERFRQPFVEAAVAECGRLGRRLTVVKADPVTGMGVVRRRRTRMTRPIRELVERQQRGCRVWLAEDVNGVRFLRRLPPDPDGIITGYGQIFSATTIERFRTLVNLHPSLLPYYQGPAPVYWCVQHGEEHSGFTLHEVTERIDDGPVLRQGVVRIADVSDATDAIVAAAIPAVLEWLRHLVSGTDFPRREVEAAKVYRVRDGYRTLAEYWENERRLSHSSR